MPQEAQEWEEISEFVPIVQKIIEKYPDRFSHIDSGWIVAYKCTNKRKPESKTKPYEMCGQSPPESFTNSKKYFVKMYYDTWDEPPERNRLAMVFSVLSRIPIDNPEAGKVLAFDFHDQSVMARTFGVDWILKSDLPDILRDRVVFKEEPEF